MPLGKRKPRSNQSGPSSSTKRPALSQKQKQKQKQKPGTATKASAKGKTKAFIEIPGHSDQSHSDEELATEEDVDDEMVDRDVGLGDEALTFLNGLDKRGITRSRLDQVLENRKNRPKQTSHSKSYVSLSKITPHSAVDPEQEDEDLDALDEDDFALGSGSDDLDLMSDMPSSISDHSLSDLSDLDSDLNDEELDDEQAGYSTDNSGLEQAYYASLHKRARNASLEPASDVEQPEDGTLTRAPKPTSRVVRIPVPVTEDGSESPEEPAPKPAKPKKRPVADSSLGARFGRLALADLLSPALSLKARVQQAKVEIAGLAQEALADPEMSLGSLKRLLAICYPTLKIVHDHGREITIDAPVRMMAILSLLAVFLDIIPGYRIRPISAAEKQVQVSQMVARQREWEEGLVSLYKRYLDVCEKEVVSSSVLSGCALKSLCQLVQAKTDFNFSQHIMAVLVRKLGRNEWDELSRECFESIVKVLKKDVKGDDSLHVVRLVGRAIKSRNYSVHPELLATLLSLRLKTELSGTRANTEKAYTTRDPKPRGGKLPWKDRVKHNSRTSGPTILSKKAKTALKERAGIEREIREAEESVRAEEKTRNQTETLKLIFGLYFRIIKLPYRSPLLPAALEGVSRFSHLVNIDFFRDLLDVLRKHIQGGVYGDPSAEETGAGEMHQQHGQRVECRDRLLCILTAFELLSGQGEALNLDLTDFVNSLYALLIPLGSLAGIEDGPGPHGGWGASQPAGARHTHLGRSTADLLVSALELVFLRSRSTVPPTRALAFTKRLLTLALALPVGPATQIVLFLTKLIHRQPAACNVLALLNGADAALERTASGVYRPELDEVELCNPDAAVGWELFVLERHWDGALRKAVKGLVKSVQELSGS